MSLIDDLHKPESETLYLYDGNTLKYEDTIEGENDGPPLHFHPGKIERFHILEGSITLRFPSSERLLVAGESIAIAPGQVHSFHTLGSSGVRLQVELTPAGDMEQFFRGMARAQREGRHPLLQIAVLYSASADFGFYLAGAPVWAQKMLFTILAPIARTLGYRASNV